MQTGVSLPGLLARGLSPRGLGTSDLSSRRRSLPPRPLRHPSPARYSSAENQGNQKGNRGKVQSKHELLPESDSCFHLQTFQAATVLIHGLSRFRSKSTDSDKTPDMLMHVLRSQLPCTPQHFLPDSRDRPPFPIPLLLLFLLALAIQISKDTPRRGKS